MQPQSYFRVLNGGANDYSLSDRFLTVNWTGFVRLPHPFQTQMPRGRADYYLIYCVAGQMSVCTDGKTQSVMPGQAIIIPPRTPYVVCGVQGGDYYYWLHFTGSDAGNFLARCDFQPGQVYTVGSNERIVRLYRELYREFLWRDQCFDDSCASYLINIVTELSRMRETERSNPSSSQVMLSLSYFHNHLDRPVSVAELAEIEHFSPSRYRAVFRRCMGMSPSEYMTGVRMRHACELLATADLSVREVAEACGYADPLYFSRVFRAHVGVAPSRYNDVE